MVWKNAILRERGDKRGRPRKARDRDMVLFNRGYIHREIDRNKTRKKAPRHIDTERDRQKF